MLSSLKKFNKILLFILLFLIKSSISNAALPFSFGLIMKPYVGTEFDVFHNFSDVRAPVKNQFFNSFYKFENMSFNLGLRVHKYLGLESYIHRFVYKVDTGVSTGSFDAVGLGIDLLLYMPIPFLYLDMIGTGLELYGGIGPSVLIGTQGIAALGATRFNAMAIKYSAGIQVRLFNKMSMRFGMEMYQLKLPNAQIFYGNLVILKTGINYYFL